MPQAGEDVLARLLEASSGAAVIFVDSANVVTRFSARAEQVLGKGATELLGMRIGELLPRRVVDGAGPLEVLRRGEAWAAAPDVASAGPHLGWAAEPLLDGAGTYTGAIFRVWPTEARGGEASAELEAQAAAFTATHVNLCVLDRNRRVVAANPAYREAHRRAFGVDLEPGQDALRGCAPGMEASFLEGFERALAGERLSRWRRIQYPTGRDMDHLVEYSPVLRGGEVVGVTFGSVEARPAGPATPRSALLERALDVSRFAVVIADAFTPDFPVVAATAGFERLTGYSVDEVVGKNLRFLQGPHRDQPGLTVMRRALAQGEPCDVVIRNVAKDGREFWNRLALTPVRDVHGIITHVIGIQEDVTELHEARGWLRAASATELTWRMLGGAVHDLRNLLTVVSTMVGLSRDDVQHLPRTAEQLGDAAQALEQAAELTQLLLSPVSRMGGGSGATVLAEALDQVVRVCRYALPRGIVLELDVPPEPLEVAGDKGALQQVIINLVLNAADAMPRGGRVTVSAHGGIPHLARPDGDEPGDPVTVAVHDEGEGLSPEARANLFKPFFSTKPAKGTGLGLSTSAALITSAGGALRVHSAPGEGTTFFVILPRATRGADVRSPPASQPLPEVLLVEPDPGLRGALAAVLRRGGATVYTAGDITFGRTVEGGTPTLLVLDATERLGGWDTLVNEWLAAGPVRKVVLLGEAGGGTTDERVRWLPKPFPPDELLAVARSLV